MLAGSAALTRAHNLDTRATNIQFAPDYVQTMSQRGAANQSLMQVGDEFWIVLETTPGPGTNTGVGGYQTYYVPEGMQVLDVAYARPSKTDPRGFAAVPMKGQSPIATGSGPIGASAAVGLTGYAYPSPNILGINEAPVTAAGVSRGTLAGVYADTGIFYSTDPRTAFNSYAAAPSGGAPPMTNNSGDTVGEWNSATFAGKQGVMTLWDSYQLRAFGRKDVAPIIDAADGRGNAPWGMASAVAGPQSGYRWSFNFAAYNGTAGSIPGAIETGPWQRIKYPGSQIAKDLPGLAGSTLGYAGVDGSGVGYDFAAAGALPAAGPGRVNAVRFAIGQLEIGRPELAAVKVRMLAPPSPACEVMRADAFGGDAGGTDNGKDHIWRYFDPTVVSLNPCVFLQKRAADPMLAPGGTTYFDITWANNGTVALPDVVLTDVLPTGMTYLGAVPPPTTVSGSTLTWSLGTSRPQTLVSIRVHVKATGTGALFNKVTATSSGAPVMTAEEGVEIGLRSLLRVEKTVTPDTVVPGGTVEYTIRVLNEGTGPNVAPLVVRDVLPEGFTYLNTTAATLNGVPAGAAMTVNAADPTRPAFVFSQGIAAGKSATVTMSAVVATTQPAGTYFNGVELEADGKRIAPVPTAPVTVGGGRIGDTVFRDWDGDGVQDAADEGFPGVGVQLWSDPNGDGNPSDGRLRQTATTDASGRYVFSGLAAGNYVVRIPAPPAGAVQTYDPEGAVDHSGRLTLLSEQEVLTMDFGYRPGGAGSIGDAVFEDIGNDGAQSPGDPGIPNATVLLHEDTDGDGVIDPDDSLVSTTSTNASGQYLFSGLATGLNYVVRVDHADPDIAAYFNPVAFQASTPVIKPMPDLVGSNLTGDFGFWRVLPGSIGNEVFADLDGNGLYNPATEIPLVGVTVALFLDGVPVATTISAADGTYRFQNLGPGNYSVVVDAASSGVPAGYSPSVPRHTVTLAAGQNITTADYPFTPILAKTVDKDYVQPGQTLTFGITPDHSGAGMLENVIVRDFVPAGTSFLSAGQGGLPTTFTSAAGVSGSDAGSAGDGSVSIAAQADIVDTWLDENSPAANYGNDTSIRVDGESSRPERTVVRFTLPATLPADAVVTSAVLKLTKLSGNPIDIIAHQADADWNEAQATWSNRLTGTAWDAAGGDYIEDPADPVINSGAATGDRTWEVGHIVQNWLAGDPNFGFLLKHPADNIGNNANTFASSEHGTAASRPTLTITYTSTARPAMTTSISLAPTVVAAGSPVTVTMTVQASENLTNVAPSALAINGGTGTLGGPTPASRNLTAGVPATFTWTFKPTRVGEFTLFGAAGNGAVTFPGATSNSVLASPAGQSTYVSWNLGTNNEGTSGLTAQSKRLYAFGGGDTERFWVYGTETGLWNNPSDPADTPAGTTVNSGGALTNDGSRYFYALRGDATRVFLRYDSQTNTWDDAGVADLPGTTDKTVLKGGALVHLDGFVYAFLGNDSTQFWRYSVAGNTWMQIAGLPGTVNNGAGLTTDGTNLYATQGDGKKGFWRYNVAANTWTVLAPFADNFGDGGSLVHARGAIYVLRGGGQKTFRRYNIATNTWTNLAPAPANIDDGTAIAYDGVCLFVFIGRTNLFYHYDLATNVWAPQSNAPATVGWGGALSFLASGNVSTTVASASPTLVSGVSQVAVRMTVTSSDAISNIAANAPAFSATGGATATFGPATLVSPDDDISGAGDPVVYQWTATVTPGTGIGEITFTTGNSTGGSANSNSVIVSPVLTFVATVNASPPAVIRNVAGIEDASGSIPPTSSNVTETATGASIGDFVWVDIDGDGAQDAAEPGLAGVRVYIDQDGDGQHDAGEPADVSDAGGGYRIFGLAAGTHAVKLDLTSVPAGYTPTTATVLSVTLASNAMQFSAADYGLRPSPAVIGTPPSSIGDTLWVDADEDGALDSGEALLGDVTVRLYNDVNNNGAIDGGDILLSTTTSDAGGRYLFASLHAGNYLVDVDETDPDMPTGLELVGGGANAAGLHDIALAPGQNVLTADFGYNFNGVIGDFLWYDTDGDGLQDETESAGGPRPAPNGTVVLYHDLDGDGVVDEGEPIIRVETTGDGSAAYPAAPGRAPGQYLFQNLAPGSYLVKVSEQEVPSPVSGRTSTMITTTGESHAVTLGTGIGESMSDLDNDFGFIEAALVDGHVFHDVNGDGLLAAGDVPLPGITVRIFAAGGDGIPGTLDDVLTAATATDADGEYRFVVPPGDYRVAYETSQIPPALSEPTTPLELIFSIDAGTERTGLDFGVDHAGMVGDLVFADADGDGIRDAGEPGLANVVVELYGDAALTMLIASTPTDAGGSYLFSGLADGTYHVKVDTGTLPVGYHDTPTADPDAPADSIGIAMVAGGGSDLSNDFGYQHKLATVTVSGTVFDDLNGSGTPGIPAEAIVGVTVTAAVDATGDGIVDQTFTTITDSNGFYRFVGIPQGSDITIAVATGTLGSPAYVQTADPDSVLDSATAVTGVSADVPNRNFGYVRQFGSIAGTVVKGDGDGLAEGGEPPQPDVVVTLTYAGADDIPGTGDDQTMTAATDPDGNYFFGGLLPGLHVISTDPPSGFHPLADRDAGHPNSIAVSLTVDQDVQDQDFEYQSGSIGDRVWNDADSDGEQDAGEASLVGVRVHVDADGDGLYDAGEPSGITGPTGDYLISGLAAGSYKVTVDAATLPAGLVATYDLDGVGTPGAATVALASNEDRRDADFGYVYNSGITGSVLADNDNDNVGDSGLAGVTLTLNTDPNGDGDPADGAAVMVTTSAAGGAYAFGNVVPGSYVVVQTQPAGYLDVGDGDGSPDVPGSPADAPNGSATDNRIPVNLGAGETDTANNFIEELAGRLGGLAWSDEDNDGLKDAGEAGINGVAVTLSRDLNGDGDFADAGEPSYAGTTTGGGGFYVFTDLPPGSYQVTIQNPPAGHPVSSTATDSADNQEDGDDNGAQPGGRGASITSPVIAISAGEDDRTIGFGLLPAKPTTFAAWQGLNSLGGQNGPTENPDGDLYSNLEEFAFCFDPRSGGNFQCPLELRAGSVPGTVDACVRRLIGASGVTYTLEAIGSLEAAPGGWSDVTTIVPVVTANGDGTETACYRNIGTVTGSGRGYVRVRVSLASPAATAWTQTAGFHDCQIRPGCETISFPLLNCELFSGVADGRSGNVLSFASGGGDVVFNASFGSGEYYIEIIGGAAAGHRFEVDEAASGVGTVALDPASPLNTTADQSGLTGAPLVIREHHTVGRMFPAPFFRSGATPGTADNILYHRSGAFGRLYLLNDTPVRWVDAADIAAADQADRVIPPGEGLFIHRRGGLINCTYMGYVRSTPFCRTLPTGYSLTAGGYPMDESAALRTWSVATGFTGDPDPATADQVLLWMADNEPGKECYRSLILLDGGPGFRYWTWADDATVNDESATPLLRRARAALVRLRSGTAVCQPAPWNDGPTLP